MTRGRIYVGVLHAVLVVPGARSLKDRRQGVRSVVDRARHRFDVSVHELADDASTQRQEIVMTTAGNDPRLLRAVLDQIRGFLGSQGGCVAASVDVDVFRWHPSDREWREDADG